MWLDASIRFIKTGHLDHTKAQLLKTDGIIQMVRVTHSIFVATHAQVYQFLPVDEKQVKHTGE